MASPPSKLEVDIEVKSSADKFWGSIRDSTTLFPKVFPELYKSIDVLEGDGKCVGSVRLLKYPEGISAVTESKERIDAVDDANMKVAYHVIGGDLLKYYKHFKAFLHVTPKGDGSFVKWSCEFEKASEEVPDPHFIQEFAVSNFKDLDAYLLKA
ncbi:hypothetical protein HHK36_015167 [Tetracentron sinense]|uniref:Bet v I/Major latex protein domain-containing protein n=1 Tax=Tetracentron sinense TaxID=13715 RepID=A0A835DFX5_TETSI|nr:hypothetical protein HHK36_015167 [Tetracentron sinense]